MDQRLEKIYDILIAHRGAGNEITSAEIAKMLNLVEDDTHSQTRLLIKRAAEEYNLALSSNRKGYFIMTTDTELDAYMSNLNSRIRGIEDRKRTMEENYRRANK